MLKHGSHLQIGEGAQQKEQTALPSVSRRYIGPRGELFFLGCIHVYPAASSVVVRNTVLRRDGFRLLLRWRGGAVDLFSVIDHFTDDVAGPALNFGVHMAQILGNN